MTEYSKEVRYKAPVAGNYLIQGKVYKYRPTGKFEDVPNPDRYWFEFWKPRMISQEIWEMYETLEGRQVVFLKEDEMAPYPILHRL